MARKNNARSNGRSHVKRSAINERSEVTATIDSVHPQSPSIYKRPSPARSGHVTPQETDRVIAQQKRVTSLDGAGGCRDCVANRGCVWSVGIASAFQNPAVFAPRKPRQAQEISPPIPLKPHKTAPARHIYPQALRRPIKFNSGFSFRFPTPIPWILHWK
jgi:hypothetical protein